MAKLHEVLAVDRDLEAAAKKILDETITTFTKKTDHFQAYNKKLEMFDDSRSKEEAGQEETKALTTTVQEKLEYVAEHLTRHIDCVAQKEATNQTAKGTVYLDGEVFIPDVPATLLLAMENKLAQWRQMYDVIPTLEPSIEWIEDPQAGRNIYKTREPSIKHKTEKVTKAVVLYPHSDKHPAQVKEVSMDVPVGNYSTILWSGKISPADKSLFLKKLGNLLGEVKKARQRANSADVVHFDIGEKIFTYLNQG